MVWILVISAGVTGNAGFFSFDISPVLLSGLPKGKIAGPEQPNFLEAQNLTNFKGLYIFIFHQTGDPLCSYEMVEKSVKVYQENGAFVEFCSEDTTGHGTPNQESITAYHEWLRKVIKQEKHQNRK